MRCSIAAPVSFGVGGAALVFGIACASNHREFSARPDAVSGSAGTSAGGTSNAGGSSTAGSGDGGRGGARVDGGDSGEGTNGGDAGHADDGGAGPAAGSGPIAGSSGSLAFAGATSGGAGGAAPSAGAGGAAAGTGGAAAGTGGAGGPAVTPTILSTIPADAASGIRSDQRIVVVFSEPMNQSATQAAFDKQSLPAGTFSWSADSRTMTYEPSTPLLYSQATAPATVQARLYSFSFGVDSKSLAGAPLAAAETFRFTTSREFALTLTPTELWSVKAPGPSSTWPSTPAAANDATQCLATVNCTSVPVGDDQSKLGVRAVLRYNPALPQGAFVEDARMYIGIAFRNGSVANFGSLQVATAPNVLAAGAPTGTTFTVNLGPNGTTTTANALMPGLISNGSFNTTDLYLTVQWSVANDGDSASDDIGLSDGFILTHYLLP